MWITNIIILDIGVREGFIKLWGETAKDKTYSYGKSFGHYWVDFCSERRSQTLLW